MEHREKNTSVSLVAVQNVTFETIRSSRIETRSVLDLVQSAPAASQRTFLFVSDLLVCSCRKCFTSLAGAL